MKNTNCLETKPSLAPISSEVGADGHSHKGTKMNKYTLLTTLRKIGKIDSEATVKQIQVLLEVSMNDGEILSSDVAALTGLTPPSVTRCLDIWGAEGVGPKPGRNFIERRPTPDDRRMKTLHLTDAGKEFVNHLMGELV